MIITDDFVYLHIPKTGGTFVEHVMQKVYADMPGTYIDTSTNEGQAALGVSHQHQVMSGVPDEHRDKDIVVTVRNPYDHYVSNFEFGLWRAKRDAVFEDAKVAQVFPHYPELSFAEYLAARSDWNLYARMEPSSVRALDEKEVGSVSWQFIRFAVPRPLQTVQAIGSADEERTFSEALARTTFIPTDNLNRELHDFLVSKGHDPAEVDFVLELDKIYPPRGGRKNGTDWRSYYTEELKSVVRDRDRLLFSLFPHFDV